MIDLLSRCLLACLIFSCTPGCDAWKRLFESEFERQRREEDEQLAAELKADLARDMGKLISSGSCIDCAIDLGLAQGTSFRGATLTGSVVGCDSCEGADLRDTDLNKAHLNGRLDGVDIRGAKVERASFAGAESMKGTRLDSVDLREIIMADATNWSGAILRGANLDKVWFMGSSGRHGHFKTSNSPMNVGLGGALATGTDFREASLRKTNFGVCDLRGAQFDNANAQSTIFNLANLNDASFVGARMEDAHVGTATAIGTNFSNVKAKGATFTKADLTSANFKGADLRDANFKDAVIQGAQFDNADLSGTTWINGTRCKKGSIGKCRTR